MGLDIYAYSKLKEAHEFGAREKRLEELGLAERGEEVIRIETVDEQAFKGLSPGTWYATPESESFSFRAGSYSGYNQWRRALSVFALGVRPEEVWNNESTYRELPFFGLINHSDCDGAIGGPVAKSLYRDFVKFRSRAVSLDLGDGQDRGWFLEIYDDFLKAFGLAADDGILLFC
jgi:hypothetical protein